MKEYNVEIKTEDGIMDTFVCHPEEGGPFPSIIFYMDAPGIREELRDMARRMGTVGYHVTLPNMYYRSGTESNYGFDFSLIRTDDAEFQKMRDLMNATTIERVVADTKYLLEFVASEPEAKKGAGGCVGYCMSGRHVVAAAAEYPDAFAAIASYYGVGIQTDEPNSPHLTADKIKGELYLAFASQDDHVPPPLLEAIPKTMEAAGINFRVEVYPDTGHGFAFPSRAVYDKAAAERHYERLFALFERNLKG